MRRLIPILTMLCALLAACVSPVPERTGDAALPLSAALPMYTITSANAPATAAACNDPNVTQWCECGTDYTDNAARCNTLNETLVLHVPPLACEPATATLSYQVSTWTGSADVSLRRILRPVTQPAMGSAGLCASSSVASWFRSGPEAWTLPGAKGDGTDRSATAINRAFPATGVRTESFDVISLVGGCENGCVLAHFATGAHVNVLAGTASIVWTCASPPAVCGDGAIGGSEACDDGDTDAGDGCSAACAIEHGWTCSGAPSVCATTCGDGSKAGAEQCDDGNAISHDGCSSTCLSEVCTCE